MSEKLVVHWKHKVTGQTGHGEPIDADAAHAWVKHGNAEYPLIAHWTEEPPPMPTVSMVDGLVKIEGAES